MQLTLIHTTHNHTRTTNDMSPRQQTVWPAVLDVRHQNPAMPTRSGVSPLFHKNHFHIDRAFIEWFDRSPDGLEAKYTESAFHGQAAIQPRRPDNMSFEQMLLDMKKKLSQRKNDKKRTDDGKPWQSLQSRRVIMMFTVCPRVRVRCDACGWSRWINVLDWFHSNRGLVVPFKSIIIDIDYWCLSCNTDDCVTIDR